MERNIEVKPIDIAFYILASECYKRGDNVVFKGNCLVRHIIREACGINTATTTSNGSDTSEADYFRIAEKYKDSVAQGKFKIDVKENVVLDNDIIVETRSDLHDISRYSSAYGEFEGICIESILANKINELSKRYTVSTPQTMCDIYELVTNKNIKFVRYFVRTFLLQKELGTFNECKAKVKEIKEVINSLGYNADGVIDTCTLFIKDIIDRKGSHFKATGLARNDDLLILCEKYKRLPIIVAGMSMADLMRKTSVYGLMGYCGDTKYENKDVVCIGPAAGFEGNSVFNESLKGLRFMTPTEVILSLVKFSCPQWGHIALCNLIRTLDEDIRWWDEIKAQNLQDKLNERLREAVGLEEDDESIFEAVEYRMQS